MTARSHTRTKRAERRRQRAAELRATITPKKSKRPRRPAPLEPELDAQEVNAR
jgi:hypothetical protein